MLVGIDAVDIHRFKCWHKYSINSLLKIFTQAEIDYCLSNYLKSAERFAARFAAKEAFFKASYTILNSQVSFLQICKFIEVINTTAGPIIKFDNLYFKYKMNTSLSITHSKCCAIVVVIIDSVK